MRNNFKTYFGLGLLAFAVITTIAFICQSKVEPPAPEPNDFYEEQGFTVKDLTFVADGSVLYNPDDFTYDQSTMSLEALDSRLTALEERLDDAIIVIEEPESWISYDDRFEALENQVRELAKVVDIHQDTIELLSNARFENFRVRNRFAGQVGSTPLTEREKEMLDENGNGSWIEVNGKLYPMKTVEAKQ